MASGWVRAKGCAASECIEVRMLPGGFEIRNSRYAGAEPFGITIGTRAELDAFLAGVKAGDFDNLEDK